MRPGVRAEKITLCIFNAPIDLYTCLVDKIAGKVLPRIHNMVVCAIILAKAVLFTKYAGFYLKNGPPAIHG
jgi:hypothetical protein